MIETSARKLKQGPQVREGLVVESIDAFDYDRERLGTTVEELGKTAQFTVGVVVQRSRVLRTRALFDPWSLTFTLNCDDELIDKEQLATWLDIGGRRIGLGDWRPEKNGSYGRFEAKIKPLPTRRATGGKKAEVPCRPSALAGDGRSVGIVHPWFGSTEIAEMCPSLLSAVSMKKPTQN